MVSLPIENGNKGVLTGDVWEGRERRGEGTYTQKPQLATMMVMSHFLAVLKLLGFKGSASPPSQPTTKSSPASFSPRPALASPGAPALPLAAAAASSSRWWWWES